MDNNICKVIHAKNMTQANLAEKVGVKREYINRIINRKVTPTVPLGLRIALALEVPMEELFFIEH
jgi:putative transcriptional regulator